jgi:hypothetical protein
LVSKKEKINQKDKAMEYKKAISVLMKMLDNNKLKEEEKEALLTAIGTLDCGALAENRFKMILRARKAKENK